jgi:hypothetical protein
MIMSLNGSRPPIPEIGADEWMKHWFGWVGDTRPNIIHLIDGEKGGVGKSLFARALLQWFLNHQYPVWGIEADRSNPNLMRTYKEHVKTVVISEESELLSKADGLYHYALDRSLVVNLPAQVYRALTRWIEHNDAIAFCRNNNIAWVKWFVSNGADDSLEILQDSLEDWGTQIPHILVRNLHMCPDWSFLNAQYPKVGDLIKTCKVPMIDFPRLDTIERNFIDSNRLSFAEALSGNVLNSLQKNRVNRFLNQTYESIDQVGLAKLCQSTPSSTTEK